MLSLTGGGKSMFWSRLLENNMKQGKAVKKIPGGKLVRVDVEYGERIEQLRITGDFFMHPEDALQAIEKCLEGADLPFDPGMAVELVEAALQEQQAVVVGFSPPDLAALIGEALK
jgi:lipoate-protein ligase A